MTFPSASGRNRGELLRRVIAMEIAGFRSGELSAARPIGIDERGGAMPGRIVGICP
jgi:hypothetical protein